MNTCRSAKWVEWSHFMVHFIHSYFSFSWRTVGKRKRARGEREWKISISLLIWESATARVAFLGSFEGLLTIFLHHFVRTSDAERWKRKYEAEATCIWINCWRSIDTFIYQSVSYFHLLHDIELLILLIVLMWQPIRLRFKIQRNLNDLSGVKTEQKLNTLYSKALSIKQPRFVAIL